MLRRFVFGYHLPRMGASVACPSENTLLALAAGTLAGPSRAAAVAHLDSCSSCRVLFSAALDELHDGDVPAQHACLGMFPEGAIVAERYRVTRYLGRGGMGVVYAAHDTLLGVPIAIKCVSPTVASGTDEVRHLCRELRHGRRVSHVNVCRVFDVGTHRPAAEGRDAGQPQAFMTMELLEGETLGARLRRERRLPLATVHELLRQIAAGLDAAHREGVIHRDLKPDNIFLVPHGETIRVVITDFGLARTFGASLASSVSSMKGMVGTAAYASPEQIEGRPVTPASDIYSLGVVLYELITGQLPFAGPSAMATAALRLVEAPPSPAGLVPDLPQVWDLAILRCLERAPERRFPTAPALLAALELGAPPPVVRRRSLPWRRIAIAGGALGIGLGLAGAQAVRPSAPPSAVPVVMPAPPPIAAAPPEVTPAAVAAPADITPPPPPAREPVRRRARQIETTRAAETKAPTPSHAPAAPTPPTNQRDDVLNPF